MKRFLTLIWIVFFTGITQKSYCQTDEGITVQGNNSISSVNGFYNKIQFSDAGFGALVFNPGQLSELMFGFHVNGRFYWGTGQNATTPNYYPMILDAKTGTLEVRENVFSKSFNMHDGEAKLVIYRDSDLGDWSLLRANSGNGVGIIGQPDVMALAVDRNNSHIGLGTSTPLSKVHIKHSSGYYSPGGLLFENSTGSSVYNFINSDNNFFIGYNENASQKYPQGSYLTRLFIKSNGYVGIGNTSPGSLLNVGTKTSREPSPIAQLGQSSPNSEARVLSLVNSGGGSNQSTSLEFHNRSDWSATGKIQLQQIGANSMSDMHFYTYNNGSLKKRMTINHKGDVGIGTNAPFHLLHIKSERPTLRIESMPNISDGSKIRFTEAAFAGAYLHYEADKNRLDIGMHHALDADPQNDIPALSILRHNRHIGIGTTNPGIYRLAVKGKVKAQEVKVSLDGWSDFVFEDSYNLASLKDVEAFITKHGHLEHIPSAGEVEKDGVDLGAMDAKLLRKIEELTLYAIDQNKQIGILKNENKILKEKMDKIERMEAELAALRKLILSAKGK
ncbi:hypothetical protein FUAX_52870 (plasmid) [Fulvitalea axinellae]|uniref:Peptidase S74 domain-containing protein n=1 Tax=Fulvitalea axinellae TaxID=1182444 RepID=A0AAU9DK06_9BACT|nr:hypothetical protein FUAX_52870 [Fulvitalea axinellae]